MLKVFPISNNAATRGFACLWDFFTTWGVQSWRGGESTRLPNPLLLTFLTTPNNYKCKFSGQRCVCCGLQNDQYWCKWTFWACGRVYGRQWNIFFLCGKDWNCTCFGETLQSKTLGNCTEFPFWHPKSNVWWIDRALCAGIEEVGHSLQLWWVPG